MRTLEQLELRFDGRRRRRRGAGRPRKTSGRSPHEKRPELADDVPVHVSLRVDRAVGRLRGHVGYRAVRRALTVCIGRMDFRIVHASIQDNHIHLIAEADDKRALANGLRAFMISCTRSINRAVGRRGSVFSSRYHMTQLRTPRQVRNAIAYVLNNWRHHGEDTRGAAQRRAAVDPYSTGVLFDGWRDAPSPFILPGTYEPLPAAGPRSWLLRIGWRKHALVGSREVPGGKRRAGASRA
jgi:REP element-mobilizing transposase RayT